MTHPLPKLFVDSFMVAGRKDYCCRRFGGRKKAVFAAVSSVPPLLKNAMPKVPIEFYHFRSLLRITAADSSTIPKASHRHPSIRRGLINASLVEECDAWSHNRVLSFQVFAQNHYCGFVYNSKTHKKGHHLLRALPTTNTRREMTAQQRRFLGKRIVVIGSHVFWRVIHQHDIR